MTTVMFRDKREPSPAVKGRLTLKSRRENNMKEIKSDRVKNLIDRYAVHKGLDARDYSDGSWSVTFQAENNQLPDAARSAERIPQCNLIDYELAPGSSSEWGSITLYCS